MLKWRHVISHLSRNFWEPFLCPQRNFGRHIVIALSVRPSVCPSRFRVRSISPIFFEVGIPNLVYGYILGWVSVAYLFWVTVTLTSDLDFRIIVSGAYLILFEVGISNLLCGCILGWRSVAYHNWVTATLNLTSDLVSRKLHWVWCFSPIIFEIGIPNLLCKCILGWRGVTWHFWVTVTLTSDLLLRIIVSGAQLLYSLS